MCTLIAKKGFGSALDIVKRLPYSFSSSRALWNQVHKGLGVSVFPLNQSSAHVCLSYFEAQNLFNQKGLGSVKAQNLFLIVHVPKNMNNHPCTPKESALMDDVFGNGVWPHTLPTIAERRSRDIDDTLDNATMPGMMARGALPPPHQSAIDQATQASGPFHEAVGGMLPAFEQYGRRPLIPTTPLEQRSDALARTSESKGEQHEPLATGDSATATAHYHTDFKNHDLKLKYQHTVLRLVEP
jgi:hypothetical protein